MSCLEAAPVLHQHPSLHHGHHQSFPQPNTLKPNPDANEQPYCTDAIAVFHMQDLQLVVHFLQVTERHLSQVSRTVDHEQMSLSGMALMVSIEPVNAILLLGC